MSVIGYKIHEKRKLIQAVCPSLILDLQQYFRLAIYFLSCN